MNACRIPHYGSDGRTEEFLGQSFAKECLRIKKEKSGRVETKIADEGAGAQKKGGGMSREHNSASG